MELSNEIVLRPRFKFKVKSNNQSLLHLFEVRKADQSKFIISLVDDHVFIKIPKEKQHFWSPQLHLEINEDENAKNESVISGLYGPNPTVWTMFMFFHFIVAGLFIAFTIWTYVNWSLQNDFSLQLFLTLFMVLIWIVLYFGGRMGKKTGMAQMQELHDFMKDTISKKI